MTSLLHAVMSATLVSGGVAEPSPPSASPPGPGPGALAERFDVLGLQVCVGAVEQAAPCDLRLWAPPRGATPTAAEPTATKTSSPPASSPPAESARPTTGANEPVQFTLFGRTVCLGPAEANAKCDVTLAPSRKGDAEA